MTIRAAINGFGRIGRCLLRAACERELQDQLAIVAINEIASLETMVYLTRYDSTHGRFPGTVETTADGLCVDGHAIAVSGIEDLDALDWRAMNVDLVFECTGSFTTRELALEHVRRGARHVLFSQPADADVDATVVYGINHALIDASCVVVSAASCTTNCIVPVIETLERAFGIESGVITTIHSVMNDQPVLDGYHHTDLRKTRAAMRSIIPVDTGLAHGIGRVLPHLKGRFEAQAMRVPTMDVSAIDLSVVLRHSTTTAEANAALRAASEGELAHILGYCEAPLASCDFIHDMHSGIVDASQTRVSGGRLLKVLTWFDNEWGYANRMLDTALYWSQQM